MLLIENASRVWHRLWSFRLAAASAVCGGAAAVLPFVAPAQPGRGFVALMFGVTVAAPLLAAAAAGARVVAQPRLKERRRG